MLASPVHIDTETAEPSAVTGVVLVGLGLLLGLLLLLGLGIVVVVPPVVSSGEPPVVVLGEAPGMLLGSRFAGAAAAMVLKFARDLEELAAVLQ
jgi:hypothetical protein